MSGNFTRNWFVAVVQTRRSRIEITLAAAFMLTCANSLFAATVAHWDFESDLIAGSAVNGQVVSHPSGDAAFDAAIQDVSGNGNHLSAFNNTWGAMKFSSNVAPVNRTDTTLSVENQPDTCCPGLFSQDDLEVGGVNVGALATWTIEASVNFKGLGGWQSMVAKDGVGQATNGDLLQAPLYFQKKGDGTQQFRINYVDAAGYGHVVDSTTVAVANQWYHVVATNDGSTMKLYVNNVLENTLDLTASPSTNLAMAALDEAGFEGTGTTVPYAWSLARGMYNDGHGDRLNGYLDDVRISNVALDPSEFLNRLPDLLPSTLRINRGTGEMLLFNQQTPVQVVGYSITSAAGALNATNWRPIADNYDATSGGEFDGDDEWTVLSAAGSKSDFSEFVFDTTPGNGGSLGSSFQIPIGVAGAWRKSIYEDVQAVLKLSNGSNVTVNVEYTGTGFDRSDLNFDGNITGADWVVFRTNNLVDLSSMSIAEAYGKGDLDGDRDNDFSDFLIFKADYEDANGGAGSFAAMIASVPEPSTMGLLLGGIGLALSRVRRRAARGVVSATSAGRALRLGLLRMGAVAVAVVGLFTSQADAVLTHRYTFNDGTPNDSVGSANGTLIDGTLAGVPEVTGGQLRLNNPGFSGPSTAANYLSLPASILPTSGSVTIEQWFTFSGSGWYSDGWAFSDRNGGANPPSATSGQYLMHTISNPQGGPNPAGGGSSIAQGTAGYNSETRAFSTTTGIGAGGGGYLDDAQTYYSATVIDSISSTLSYYVYRVMDGVGGLQSSVSATPLSSYSFDEALIGRSPFDADPATSGSVDEFRISNHAFTAQQVADSFVLGPAPSPGVGLVVNKQSGEVTIKNTAGAALTIDHYSIKSLGGALNNTWSGLGGLDSVGAGEGQSWSKAGGADANELAELFLASSSPFDPNESHSIGTAYNPAVFGAADGDLVFQYHLTSGERLYGPVMYVSGASVSGDYNGNGVVDAADYTYWRDRLGQNSPLPNTNPADVDGVVTQAEYNYWKSRFGATSGSGGGSQSLATTGAVPEPTTAVLAMFCAGLAALVARRRTGSLQQEANYSPRSDSMTNHVSGLRSRAVLTALALIAVLGTSATAATKDRFYQFGDDPVENPSDGISPTSDFGPFAVDSVALNPSETDFSDLGYTAGPVYVNTNALARPGSVAGEWGVTFNGTDSSLFRTNGGLGAPAIGDDDSIYAGDPNYTGITTRLIDGWVRPTNLALGRQDIVNDTAQFGVFISADDKWGFIHGTTTITSTTAVTPSAWAHVMHRTFTNTAGALYVNGVAVAATNNDYNAGAATGNLVFGASLDQTANYFAGQLDNFSVSVAGDNSAVANGDNWGEVNLAVDNDYIRQQLLGKEVGDVNLSGGAPNATDVSVFVTNWRATNVVNGVTLGDITTRVKGDLDFDGDIDLDDAFTLHTALLGAGAGGLDFSLLGSGVPEPGSLILLAVGVLAGAVTRRRR